MRRDLVSPLFVGRETELATMTTALESAVAGTLVLAYGAFIRPPVSASPRDTLGRVIATGRTL